MSEPVVCPSGLSGSLRGLSVEEERILSDRRLIRSGRLVTRLLETCWMHTDAAGPYTIEEAPDWRAVLQGDRFAAILALRCATYGPEYDFELSCKACRHRFKWRINLSEDLVRKELTAEDAKLFREGNRFSAEAGGREVIFRLMTGADEERLAKVKEPEGSGPISSALKARIVEVPGLKASEIDGWLRGLPMREALALRRAFEAHDCGVETEIEIECPACEEAQRVELPFDREFWLPT